MKREIIRRFKDPEMEKRYDDMIKRGVFERLKKIDKEIKRICLS